MDTQKARSAVRNALRRVGFELVPVQRGEWEAESLLGLHLHKLFARLGVDAAIDVGARAGEYGAWLRRNGYSGPLVSFEPVAESYAVLERRASADPVWTTRRCALGRDDGMAEINVAHATEFSSFHAVNDAARSEFGSNVYVDRVERVERHRLDALLPDLFAPSARNVFLKVDTQGWDLEVLEGATGTLDRIVALQTEVSMHAIYEDAPTIVDSLAWLDAHGYAVSGFFPVGYDARGRVLEFDCVAVRDAAR